MVTASGNGPSTAHTGSTADPSPRAYVPGPGRDPPRGRAARTVHSRPLPGALHVTGHAEGALAATRRAHHPDACPRGGLQGTGNAGATGDAPPHRLQDARAPRRGVRRSGGLLRHGRGERDAQVPPGIRVSDQAPRSMGDWVDAHEPQADQAGRLRGVHGVGRYLPAHPGRPAVLGAGHGVQQQARSDLQRTRRGPVGLPVRTVRQLDGPAFRAARCRWLACAWRLT